MAVADAFDAMTTDRPYRSALTREMALEEIKQNKGTQFCPEVAELFVKVICSFPDDLYLLINSCAQEALQVD